MRRESALCAIGVALLAVGCCAPTQHKQSVDIELPSPIVGGYEHVSAFLPDDEAAAIVDGFDWAQTAALAETAPDGSPAVYYVVIRVDSLDHFDALEASYTPWDVQPLFPSERRDLPDEPLTMSAGGAHGGWVFALLSGRAYNYLRDAALRGEPLFEVVALRDVPPEVATHPGGSIDIGRLLASGAQWPRPPRRTLTSGDAVGAQTAALTEALTDLIAGFIQVGQEVVDAILDFFASIFGATSDTASVRVALTISTPDAEFVPANAPLLRTWGPTRGAPLENVGQEVSLQQADNPLARWRTTLTAGNLASFEVPSGHTYRFCTRNELGGARVINFWVPTQTCSAPFIIPDGAEAVRIAGPLADQDLQALTIAVDAVDFFATLQAPIRPPIIASGNHAEALAVSGNGFVVGLGGRDPATVIASTMLDGSLAAASTIGFPELGIPPGLPLFGIPGGPEAGAAVTVIRALMNVDVVWPPGNPSRLVFAHELGHHALFQRLIAATPPFAPHRYGQHLNTIFLGTVANGFAQIEPGNPFFEAMSINEGVADLIGGQLAGGGNRLSIRMPGVYTGNSIGTPAGVGQPEVYCDATFSGPTPGCFDFNVRGTEATVWRVPVNLEASRISTTLHDVIDDSVGDITHNGNVWQTRTDCPGTFERCPSSIALVPLPDPSAGLAEERVAQPLGAVLAGLGFWLYDPLEGSVFAEQGFMHGMTRAMRVYGATDDEICQLYGLHTPGGECPAGWMLP